MSFDPKNPADWNKRLDTLPPNVGDFTPFYSAVAICTIIGFVLFVINTVFYCSRYKDYWCDHNTGNRWLIPLFTKTPTGQPPLDLEELDEAWLPQPVPEEYYYPDNYSDFDQPNVDIREQTQEFVELVRQHKPYVKKESDL